MLYLFIIAMFLLFVIWISKGNNAEFVMYVIALTLVLFVAIAPIFA